MFIRFFLSISLLILTTGCSKLAHLNELLTLKSVADSQTAMAKEVEATDKNFDKLLSDLQAGRLSADNTQRSIKNSYGKPILTDNKEKDGITYEVWLYRRATKYSDTDKVYFYFDSSGQLQSWEHIQPQKDTPTSPNT